MSRSALSSLCRKKRLMFSFNCAFTYSADGSRSSCKLNNGKWLLWPFRTASNERVMPYRILYNDVQREGAKLSPALASGLSCHVPLHNKPHAPVAHHIHENRGSILFSEDLVWQLFLRL